ncbi:C4-dicarboxylate transporter [Gracilibacillus halophilus YIM-C55.5]|uniref:C4-dicarboxylate transporter n=1 Tax=Gracilibacillus halophilus YIM-C55.5 TaxID=1308866 RepID=N4W629_9BACI|nr:C4-dicarboxylate transporter [Gracilibacillus halophilus YIM-C55.5]
MTFIQAKLQHLNAGYFALVMATGALSISLHLMGWNVMSLCLFYLNISFYIVLALFTVIRLIFFTRELIYDLTSHWHGPNFFTLIAGTNIVGSECIFLQGNIDVAITLWVISILFWFLIMYTFFTAVTIRSDKPTLAQGIHGGWLIAVVATQSIAVLGALLIPYIENDALLSSVYFTSLVMYLLGCMLYLSLITLILYRLIFASLSYHALTPLYWINMGAMAISTLAGSIMIMRASYWDWMNELLPFLKGITLFFWVAGSWWIPLLIILMIWRYVIHRYPFMYDLKMWGMVFPLAMYSASTYQLAKALHLPFLTKLAQAFVYPALICWGIGIILFVSHMALDYHKFNYSS